MRINVSFKTLCVALALTVGWRTAALAAPVEFRSGVKQVSLLELYTSEGCSSCPPAEAWLNRLNGSPDLWKTFVPLAFHVDYWDSLGWKDRLAAPEYSERQRAYAQLWHSENIYTPCFVLNGEEWHNWFNLRGTPPAPSRWNVTFTPVGAPAGGYEIHAVLLAGGVDSDVKAGENGGRRLHHEFGVLDLIQLGMTTSNGVVRGKFILDPARFRSEKVLALAAWVTQTGELTPVQATGGWVVRPGS